MEKKNSLFLLSYYKWGFHSDGLFWGNTAHVKLKHQFQGSKKRAVWSAGRAEQLDMGSPGTTSTQQKPMAHFGQGLMCYETRTVLSMVIWDKVIVLLGKSLFIITCPVEKRSGKSSANQKEQTKTCLGQAIFETDILAPSWNLFSLWECYMSYLVVLRDFRS